MMEFTGSINYLALLACVVSSAVIGMLWYGPLFGKPWMKLMGIFTTDPQKIAEMKKSATSGYIVSMVSAIVMGFITSHFVDYMKVTDIAGALTLATWLWLGYIATSTAVQNVWGKKNCTLFAIDAAYQWVNLAMITLIVGVWLV